MANILSGRIEAIFEPQTIASKNGGNPLVKREFVIRALRFNPNDGSPELSERNTPILEIQGQDNVTVLNNFKVGDVVRIEFGVEGRSVTNQDNTTKFFNSVRAYRVEKLNVQLSAPTQNAQQPAQQAPAPAPAPQGQQQYQGQGAVQPHTDAQGNPLPF